MDIGAGVYIQAQTFHRCKCGHSISDGYSLAKAQAATIWCRLLCVDLAGQQDSATRKVCPADSRSRVPSSPGPKHPGQPRVESDELSETRKSHGERASRSWTICLLRLAHCATAAAVA